MKKNVFSRTIAVLASMTVLGAASMMSASAKSVEGAGEVKVEEGATSASFGLTVSSDIAKSEGCMVRLTANDPGVFTSVSATGKLTDDEVCDINAGYIVTFLATSGVTPGTTYGDITVGLAEGVAPGTYSIKVEPLSLDVDGEDVGTGEDGDKSATESVINVVVEAKATEATQAPTEAPTEAATTAEVTTAKKGASPKTGSAGVAVAVAGLVTAGATAVVLKKKH